MNELENAIASIRALVAGGAGPDQLVPLVRVLAAKYGKVRAPVFEPGTRLYRATRYHKQLPTAKDDLWFPPADRVKAGRANDIGQPVFYCSVHQSPALAEIEAGPHNIVVISEWVTQNRLVVQELGFEELAFARFGVSRAAQAHQIEDVRDASAVGLRARQFISDAFLTEDPASYALTAAIANVFTESDVIRGLRYPSLAAKGRADNFALRPDYVRENMRLEAATYFSITKTAPDGTYDYQPIADLSDINQEGTLSWTYRDGSNHLAPGTSLPLKVHPGDRHFFQVHDSTDVVIDDRRYTIHPGASLETRLEGQVVIAADGTIIEGALAPTPAAPAAGGTSPALGKAAAALAREANSRLAEFQSILGITVRSREIADSVVSVATAAAVTNLDLSREPWTCKVVRQSALEFHDPRVSPESVAWWQFLLALQAAKLPLPTLLVVEGGIETLASINARAQPIIGTELLPAGFALAWGRQADPSDVVSCKLMHLCAQDANEVLEWLASHPQSLASAGGPTEHYARSRVWHVQAPSTTQVASVAGRSPPANCA